MLMGAKTNDWRGTNLFIAIGLMVFLMAIVLAMGMLAHKRQLKFERKNGKIVCTHKDLINMKDK